ncbi:MAG: YesL family protein [Oscillospiraceae bacterium]|nr:YesL family protein [Oscillospiraceae bacterium]
MSFLGFGADYEKAGSGISKNAPQKKPFFRFGEMYFGRFWKMLKLSMLTFLFCIPIVTIGPAIAGMTKVLRTYYLDKDAFLWHEFMKGFTQNLKKSIPVGLIDVIFGISLICAMNVYPAMGKAAEAAGGSGTIYTVLCVISVSFALTVLMMNFYAFPMIVATELNFKNIIRNSFFLTCIGLKRNIITLLIVLLTVGMISIFTLVSKLSLLLVPVWAIGFLGFVIIFNSYPLIQKYVIDPYYEEQGRDNPEYDYLKPLDAEEAVFIDKGGEEAPVEGKKSKKKNKGRTIS